MYSPKHARVRYVSPQQPIATPGEYHSRVTIWKLSDEVLLSIFRYYLDSSPRFWPRLVHVCRKWRHIVFAAQRALHLRIFCARGTSVSEAIDCWPAIDIVVEYGGSLALDPPAPNDEDNIMAALEQSDRVSSISLTVTSSLLEKLSAIKKPFSELEDLALVSRDSVQLTLPRAFAWSTRLRSLHLTGIAFLALPRLLYSSRNLVDLQLHEVPNPWLFSPEALADALSEMAQLRSLSLHFPSTLNHIVAPQPSGEHIVLPALTRLNFRGIAKYLEDLVARIDAPRLDDIDATFLDESTFDLSKLSGFVKQIKMHKSHRRAHIISSERVVSISLIQPGAPTCLKLQLLCGQLSEHQFFMDQLCIHFSAFLFNVEDLRLNATRPSRWEDGLYTILWLKLLNSFSGVKWFHVTGNLTVDIVRVLKLSEGWPEDVLPALHKLYIPQPGLRLAPLSDALVSFMTSRRLSGHPIGVEYERLCDVSELHRTGHFSQQVTMETLSEDVLLNIFLYYLDTSPRSWPELAHVCQRWRQIVFTSPLGLNLRLYCTYGTPVLKALNYWPALPIVVQYGGVSNIDPPTPEDDDNIIAALKKSGRVSSISLTVTSSLLEKLSAIPEPFSELEELDLLSQDNTQLSLPSTFRWGARLLTLHSTRIASPSLPQLLLPSQDLVDLQLHEIPSAGYFSPEGFADALSGMTQLRTLSLHFLVFPSRRKFLDLPPPLGERIVLPSLACFKYRGTSKYLDSFVARIDAPRLGDINITFFSQPTMDASQLGRFIDRTDILNSRNGVDIRSSENAISISFTNLDSSSSPLQLQISCSQSDWQLSSMAQICDQFSSFLFSVLFVRIDTGQSSSEQDDVGGEQWPDVIRSFGGATDFWVTGELTADVLRALDPTDGGHTTALPALLRLHIEKPLPMYGRFTDSVESFITSRLVSGHPVEVYAQEYLCHICQGRFKQQQDLKTHLSANHRDLIVCPYCGDFKCTTGNNHLFREHLESKHPEVACNVTLVSKLFPTPSQRDDLIDRHSSLRLPDTTKPATMSLLPQWPGISTADETQPWPSDTPSFILKAFANSPRPSSFPNGAW